MAYAQWEFGGGKYTNEQALAFLIHGYVASYILTGWECTGCYPLQWHCSKVYIAIVPRTGGGLSIHVQLPGQGGDLRGFAEGRPFMSLEPTGHPHV